MGKTKSEPRPVVGIPCGLIFLPEHNIPSHGVGERYIRGVREGAGCDVMLIPALPELHDFDALADQLDGLFLTGGRANVEPHHYGGPPFPEDEFRDSARDNTILPLIRACIAGDVPIFGTCRGLQEINVALGGSLHYRVHLVEGKMDHRMPTEGDIDTRFALRHDVHLSPDGLFEGLIGARSIRVNTAHGQGIDRLGEGLAVEARAPDGIIEGIRVTGAKTFQVAVQWHAEHRFGEHALSRALYDAFGEAARARRAGRGGD